MARAAVTPSLRIPTFHATRNSPVRSVHVAEPSSSAEVLSTYELLCDDHGQACGDAFLAVLQSIAEQRGLVDASGRRTRKSRQLTS
jgi:hypothetical protein